MAKKTVVAKNVVVEEIHISSDFTFALEFRNKNLAVIFNSGEHARWHNIDQPWTSVAISNAIGHILAGTYKTFEPGLYMKYASFADLRDTMGDKNAGYVKGNRLSELVADGTISRFKEVNPEGIYRIMYDGKRVISAALLTYVPYIDGEYENVKHDRNAIELFDNFEYLRKASIRGVNLSMIFPEATTDVYNEKKVLWDLYVAGKHEEMRTLFSEGFQKAKMAGVIRHYETIAKKAEARNEPFVVKQGKFVIKTNTGETVEPADLLGRTIQFSSGSTTLRTKRTVGPENLDSIIGMLKNGNMSVVWAEPEVVGKNALLPA